MTVTLERTPETLRRVEHRAKQHGKPIEDFLEELIEENVENETGQATLDDSSDKAPSAWKQRFHDFLESIEDKNYPNLPDEALRRENIYEDRF